MKPENKAGMTAKQQLVKISEITHALVGLQDRDLPRPYTTSSRTRKYKFIENEAIDKRSKIIS